MSTSTLVLLSLTVALPCTLLALAVVYHARLITGSAMPAADEGWDLLDDEAEAPAMAPAFTLPMPPSAEPDPTFLELRRTLDNLQGQLAQQHAALTALLSDQEHQREAVAPPARFSDALTDQDGLRTSVRRLKAEGLSERAIARRLHIGLEEVRLVSQQRERAS